MQSRAETVRANRSLSLWQPYRAPSYASYGEALKGLYKQGTPQAFYKGNAVRAVHILMFHKLNTELIFKVEQIFPAEIKQIKKDMPGLLELILSCSIDMML